MTSRQAELINIMLSQHYNSATYKDAYSELRGTCSDALVQPTVTVSASGTANQHPPSTPKPLGPEWWKERQAEALKEQIDIIADKNLKIETLTNQVELLKKQIEEDKEHWQKKSAIDTGYRMHLRELVQSNKEILETLKHHGLYVVRQCLTRNIKEVIQLCAERGKQIEELRKDKEASVIASNKILGALNESGLRQYDGSLADNVVSVVNECEAQEKQIESLKKEVEDRNDEIAKYVRNNASELVLANKEIIDSLRHWGLRSNTGSFVSNVTDVIKQCAERGKEIEEFRKVVRDRNDEIEKLKGRIEVLDRMAKARRQFDETDRVLMEKKDKEIESLKKQIEVRQGFTQQDREIIAARNTEIADLRKQVSTLTKQVSQRDMTIAVLNKQIDQKETVINVITGQREVAHKNISEINKNLSEEMRETEDLKKQLETAVRKREGIVKAGNNLRDTLKEIRSYNKLLMGEELLSDTAIALWEDSTK